MTSGDIIQWVAIAVSAVSLLGAATVYLRSSASKGETDKLERRLEQASRWTDDLEKRLDDLQERFNALTKAHEALQQKAVVLEGIANSREEIAEMRSAVLDHIDDHHDQVTSILVQQSLPLLTSIDHRLELILDVLGRLDACEPSSGPAGG